MAFDVQEELIGIVVQAIEMGEQGDPDAKLSAKGQGSDGEMWELFSEASKRPLTDDEFERFHTYVQTVVRLPQYTIRQAAAWLGMSVQGVRWNINSGKLTAIQPGRDLFIAHKHLWAFFKSRD